MPKWHFLSGILAYEYLDEMGIEVHLLVKPFAKEGLSTREPRGGDKRSKNDVRHRASLVRLRIKNRVHARIKLPSSS